MATPTLPTLPTIPDLKLNISGTLPGEAVLTEFIKLQEILFSAASPDIKQKIANDLGKSIDRLWTIWERILNFLHIPNPDNNAVTTTTTVPGSTPIS